MTKSATFLMCAFLSVFCISMQTPNSQKGAAPAPAARKKWSCPLELRVDHGMTAQSDIRFRLRTPITDPPRPAAQELDCSNLEITDESGNLLSIRAISLEQHKDGLSIFGELQTRAPHPKKVHVTFDLDVIFVRDAYEDLSNSVHVAFTLAWDAAGSTWRLDKDSQPIVRKRNEDQAAP